ncbi:MAG: polysaccharide deacetylase family protein [Clostridiales bacterium]|nr:polysaccharide deacetylase family protein [Clostridiales bacterium]
MKRSGTGAVIALALVMITALSILYWKDVGEKVVAASTGGSGRRQPICSVETKKQEVAVSFDVDGEAENLLRILEVLEGQQTKATFFVTGNWVEKYPEEVKAILEAGHDLGNHGENHRQMSELSAKECREEIMLLHERVKKLTGYEMELFRPPYGEYNDTVAGTASACGYHSVCWSIDSLDWKNYGAEDIKRQVLENENLGNGAIILFRSGSKYTEEALGKALEGLREKGYTPVPVSWLLADS